MKAREVVAGWPRGRSTAAWCGWDCPRHWLFNPYALAGVQFVDVFGKWIDGEEYLRLRNQFAEDVLNAQQEFRFNRAYHASQQRMVDAYRYGYSTLGYFARETESGLVVVIPDWVIGIPYAAEPNSSAGAFIGLSREGL